MGNRKLPSPFRFRGRWRAQLTLRNGLRPSCDFDRFADAKAWIAEQAGNANTDHLPELGGPTLATLAMALRHYAGLYAVNKGGAAAELNRINHYLQSVGEPPLRLETDASGRCHLASYHTALPAGWQAHRERRLAARTSTYAQVAALAQKRCSVLNTADIRRLVAAMQCEGLSASTIQKEVALLKHLFNVASAEWNWKGFENPCRGIKLGKSQQRFVSLSQEERERLWAALDQCDNPYVRPLVERFQTKFSQEAVRSATPAFARVWGLMLRVRKMPNRSLMTSYPSEK